MPEEEQKKLLDLYNRVLENKIIWPKQIFRNKYVLDEEVRVLIPQALQILDLSPEKVKKNDLKKVKLRTFLGYYNNSVNKLLQVSYPWIRINSGRSEKWNLETAVIVIRDLIETEFNGSLEEAKKKIKYSHFRDRGLLRILYSPKLGLNGSLKSAISLAYMDKTTELRLEDKIAGDRDRTCVGTEPTALEAVSLSRY